MEFLCQASKPVGCTSPLRFYKPSSSQDQRELCRVAWDVSEPLPAQRQIPPRKVSAKLFVTLTSL